MYDKIMNVKPIPCKHDGCHLTFTSEDHLLVHNKRHEMVLNVGLANKNQVFTDDTPTPTRFIRNCEEVGLFQDLQNVNPFDETFKKAIDHSKNSPETQFIPSSNLNISDDTLHTPHIFPHIEAVPTKNGTSNNISSSINTDLDLDSDAPLDRSDGLIIIDDSDEEVDQIIVDINQSNLKDIHLSDITGNKETDNCVQASTVAKDKISRAVKAPSPEPSKDIVVEKISLKDKLRERLQIRNGSIEEPRIEENSTAENQVEDNTTTEKYLPQPIYQCQRSKDSILTDTYNQSLVVQKPPRNRRSITTNDSVVSSTSTEIAQEQVLDDAEDDDILVVCNKEEDRKLRNRVAQSRSRMRKKMHNGVLNDQLKLLQTETDGLKCENQVLKKQVHELKKYILAHHEKCAFTGDMSFLKKCLPQEGVTEKPKPETPSANAKKRKILPAPSKNVQILKTVQIQPSANPIIVNVPPIKVPADGSVNYIVITPPPTT